MASDHGPVEGAQVADWPIGYDDLAPYYDIVERRVGVQGDRSAIPARTLEQSPRRRDFVMPPNPTGHAASLLAEGAAAMGFEAYPYPAAVNSEPYDGRPACNSCGLCSGFGCTDQRPRRRPGLLAQPGHPHRPGPRRPACLRAPDRDQPARRPGPGRALPAPGWQRPPAAGHDRGARRQPDQHRTAAAALAQQRPPGRPGQPVGPGRPEHDVPQLHPGGGPLRRGHQAAPRPVDDAAGR